MSYFADRFKRDRRVSERHNLKAQLRVQIWKSPTPEQRAESTNLSSRGLYFLSGRRMKLGEVVEVYFAMPEEITGVPETEWRCVGHVVRVEELDASAEKFGVGVQFDFYEVRPGIEPAMQHASQTADLPC